MIEPLTLLRQRQCGCVVASEPHEGTEGVTEWRAPNGDTMRILVAKLAATVPAVCSGCRAKGGVAVQGGLF